MSKHGSHFGHFFLGSAVVAALTAKRSCLAIEINGVQYVHGKIRCVTELAADQPSKRSEECENAEKEPEEEEDEEPGSDDTTNENEHENTIQ